MNAQRVAVAEIEVSRSRARLIATVHAISSQLEPKRLAREFWESAKVKGADLAEDAVDAVRSRPYTAGAVVAGIAAFLAREPLLDLASEVAKKGRQKIKRTTKAKAGKDSEDHK